MASTYRHPAETVLSMVAKHIAITSHMEYFGEESLDIVFDEEKLINEIGKHIPMMKEGYNNMMYSSSELIERQRVIEHSIPMIRIRIGDYVIEAREEFKTMNIEESKGYKITDKRKL